MSAFLNVASLGRLSGRQALSQAHRAATISSGGVRKFGGTSRDSSDGKRILMLSVREAKKRSLALSLLPEWQVQKIQVVVPHSNITIEDRRAWQVLENLHNWIDPTKRDSFEAFVDDVSSQVNTFGERLDAVGFPDTVFTIGGSPGSGKSFFLDQMTRSLFHSSTPVSIPTKDANLLTLQHYFVDIDPLNSSDQHKSHPLLSQVTYAAHQATSHSVVQETCVPGQVRGKRKNQIIIFLERDMTPDLMTKLTTEQREGGAPVYNRQELTRKMAQSNDAKRRLELELSSHKGSDGSCVVMFVKNDGHMFKLTRVFENGQLLVGAPEDPCVYLESLRGAGKPNF